MKKIISYTMLLLLFASVATAGTLYKTKSGFFGSAFKSYFDKAVKVYGDGDKQALRNMLQSKKIFMLKPGLPVYISDTTWTGSVKIRIQGGETEIWTFMEAIERQ